MKRIRNLTLAIGCLSLAGCMPHFKEVDSYNTNFADSFSNPAGIKDMPNTGDPYTFGGVAEGSGGQNARQSYATDNDAHDFRDATATGVMGEISKDRTPTPDQTNGTLPGADSGLKVIEDSKGSIPGGPPTGR